MKTRKRAPNREAALIPDCLLICENVLWSSHGGRQASLINLIDAFHAEELPYDIGSFWFAARFFKNPMVSKEEAHKVNLRHHLKMVSPTKVTVDLGTYAASLKSDHPLIYGLYADYTNQLRLLHSGMYRFEIYEETDISEARLVMQRPLAVHVKPAESRKIIEAKHSPR
jgi:hypothetical protein